MKDAYCMIPIMHYLAKQQVGAPDYKRPIITDYWEIIEENGIRFHYLSPKRVFTDVRTMEIKLFHN